MANPWDEIVNAVQNPGNAVKNVVQGAGNLSRQYLGSYGYNPLTFTTQYAADYYNQEDKKKQAESEAESAHNQEQSAIGAFDQQRAHQASFAADLKNNAFRDAGLLTNQVAGNERRAMADKIRGEKTSANSRGLLGSGFQKSGEAGARAEAAANTASKQYEIQQMLGQQVMDAENLQGQLGLEAGGVQQNMADQYYRMAVENMKERNQSYGELLGAGGRATGSYLGRQGLGSGNQGAA